MADRPLNRVLYRRLGSLFGAVKICPTGAGEAMQAKAVIGWGESKRLSFSHRGEYYQVSCPYCTDTRFRLYVNHMFGQKDGHGRYMRFLAHCFNEDCLADEQNRDDFVARLGDADWLAKSPVDPGKVVADGAHEVCWPGLCVPLAELPETHPAVAYVRSRAYDPHVLSAIYKVAYCAESRHFLARRRIIIPVFERGVLVGWQARHVGELDWKGPNKKELPPKYFSCPSSRFRSQCVYNWDRMRQWQTGVIVEGPVDVWRFGAMAGCIFGNTMTDAQRALVLRVFRTRTLVLVLDPEEFESTPTRALVDFFEKEMGNDKFCAVKLPDGTDPGSLDRDVSWAYVKAAAADQGVKVVYRKAV